MKNSKLQYSSKLLRVPRFLSIILILSMVNLNLVIPGTEHSLGEHSGTCACYTEYGRCNPSHLCDCCKEKYGHTEQVSQDGSCHQEMNTQSKEDGSCHLKMSKKEGHHESGKQKMSKKTTVTTVICRPGCSKAQYGFLSLSLVDPCILTKRPNVEPNKIFSICKTFSFRKPLTPFINPPEKPPKFIA